MNSTPTELRKIDQKHRRSEVAEKPDLLEEHRRCQIDPLRYVDAQRADDDLRLGLARHSNDRPLRFRVGHEGKTCEEALKLLLRRWSVLSQPHNGPDRRDLMIGET